MKKRLMIFWSLLILLAASPSWSAPRYVFLYIGDGMGLAHRQLAESFLASGESEPATPSVIPLRMNSFPVQALTRTYSAESYITDSAAAATAFATGHKTMKGFHGSLPDGTPAPSIAELLHRRGWKIGIVTTSPLNDATPGAFYAHTTERDSYSVGVALPESGFEFFAGGPFSRPRGKGQDQQDLRDIAAEAGYHIVTLESADIPAEEPVICFAPKAELFDGCPYALDTSRQILRECVELGIQRLQNASAFFMMVEGGKIDWASHTNDTRTAIAEVLALDEALQPALDFARANPDETLILVTSDHETGGLSLGCCASYETDYTALRKQKGSNETIYQALKPLIDQKAAFEEVLPVIMDRYGFPSLSAGERTRLARAWDLSLTPLRERKKRSEIFESYGSYDPVILESQRILANRAGIGWSTAAHTGVPVPLSAVGEGAEKFSGFYDNTEIFTRLKSLLLEPESE